MIMDCEYCGTVILAYGRGAHHAADCPVVKSPAKCDLCQGTTADVVHLPLYVMGSEGVRVCLACRIILTGVAKGLRAVAGQARKAGFIAGKGVKVSQ